LFTWSVNRPFLITASESLSLIKGLKKKKIGSAGLDVYEE